MTAPLTTDIRRIVGRVVAFLVLFCASLCAAVAFFVVGDYRRGFDALAFAVLLAPLPVESMLRRLPGAGEK